MSFTPTDPDSDYTPNNPPGNAGRPNLRPGNIDFKVTLWKECPISRYGLFDSPLLFNNVTKKTLGKDIADNLESVAGDVQGVYLKTKNKIRSNFIVGVVADFTKNFPTVTYRDINPALSSFINPIYKDHQTWVLYYDIFGRPPLPISEYTSTKEETINTEGKAKWFYDIIRNNTNVDQKEDTTIIDKLFDIPEYETEAFIAPYQAQVADFDKFGIHWGLLKKEALFRGEDFYVEFQRISKENTTPNIEEADIPTFNWYAQSDYHAIDVRTNKKVPFEYTNPDTGQIETISDYPVNTAVVSYGVDENTGQLNNQSDKNTWSAFDFSRQAYYIIEIGPSSEEPEEFNGHYFIIITEHSFPICVEIRNEISYLIGQYEGVTGSSLINQDRLAISIRNHLGKLVVEFGGQVSPWIIERSIITGVTSQGEFINKTVPIIVPNASIRLFGGNINSRILFTPTEYEHSFIFEMPQTYQLETDTFTELLLTSTDQYTQIVSNNNIVTVEQDGSYYNNNDIFDNGLYPLFNQDAQLISEIRKGALAPGLDDTSDVWWLPKYLGYPTSLKELQIDNTLEIPKYIDPSIIELDRRDIPIPPNTPVTGGTVGTTDVFSKKFRVRVKLQAGGHIFPVSKNPTVKDPVPWHLTNCKTPILSHFRILNDIRYDSNGDPLETPMWEANSVNITHHVESITDTWSSETPYEITHNAHMKLAVNMGNASSGTIITSDEHPDLSNMILDLRSKNFYVTIEAGYSPDCFGAVVPRQRIFTGFCQNSKLNIEQNRAYVDCPLLDYSKILQESIVLNSPFFDGIRDIDAIFLILKLNNFAELQRKVIQDLMNSNIGGAYATAIDRHGREVKAKFAALPMSYDRIQSPFFRAKDGGRWWAFMGEIAKRQGKAMYFDGYGDFHFEDMPDSDTFYTSVQPISVHPVAFYSTRNSKIKHGYQPIFNSVRIERDTETTHNVLQIISATPDGALIQATDTYYPLLTDINKSGFIGYKRKLFQQEGIFGSIETIKDTMRHYSKLYVPPIKIEFESFGRVLRGLDIIEVDGHIYRITSINSEIIAESNTWRQSIQAEWWYQGPDISFLEEELLPSPSPGI